MAGLVELCRGAFERYFGSVAEKTYHHVMDATSISQQNWCHEDFPFDKFFSDETDDSVLAWQPKRATPSPLSPEIQTKTGATLGKNAIVVPPALDEKMKDDPALREKVAANIAQVYAFHVGSGPRPVLPGTKFYGTRLYSAIVVLNENGEVKHCRVSGGGGWIGPDEKTLRQIEQEQKRKAKRKAENHLLNEKASMRYFETCRVLFQNDAVEDGFVRPQDSVRESAGNPDSLRTIP